MKKTKYVGFRITEEELARLEAVERHIARHNRGEMPDRGNVLKSLIGFYNPNLVSPEERAYLAGETDALSGDADAHDTGTAPTRPRIRVRRID